MANTEQTTKRSQARAKRAANRKAAETQAAKDEQLKKAAVVEAQKKEGKKAAPAKSRKQTRAEAVKAAEEQAEKDAHLKATEPEVQLVKGSTPSLHELNAMAKRANREIRDTARDAANAAGKAAFDVLRGKQPGTTADAVVRRHRTVARAQVSLAQAAAKAGQQQERDAK